MANEELLLGIKISGSKPQLVAAESLSDAKLPKPPLVVGPTLETNRSSPHSMNTKKLLTHTSQSPATHTSRRHFLQTTALAASAFSVAPGSALGGASGKSPPPGN